MRVKTALLILLVISLGIGTWFFCYCGAWFGSGQEVYAQTKYPDPFKPLLPEKPKVEPPKIDLPVNPGQIDATPVPDWDTVKPVVSAILWSADKPRVLIGNDIYKVGDRLQEVDGQIEKIEKNKVIIRYAGTSHEAKIEAGVDKKSNDSTMNAGVKAPKR